MPSLTICGIELDPLLQHVYNSIPSLPVSHLSSTCTDQAVGKLHRAEQSRQSNSKLKLRSDIAKSLLELRRLPSIAGSLASIVDTEYFETNCIIYSLNHDSVSWTDLSKRNKVFLLLSICHGMRELHKRGFALQFVNKKWIQECSRTSHMQSSLSSSCRYQVGGWFLGPLLQLLAAKSNHVDGSDEYAAGVGLHEQGAASEHENPQASPRNISQIFEGGKHELPNWDWSKILGSANKAKSASRSDVICVHDNSIEILSDSLTLMRQDMAVLGFLWFELFGQSAVSMSESQKYLRDVDYSAHISDGLNVAGRCIQHGLCNTKDDSNCPEVSLSSVEGVLLAWMNDLDQVPPAESSVHWSSGVTHGAQSYFMKHVQRAELQVNPGRVISCQPKTPVQGQNQALLHQCPHLPYMQTNQFSLEGKVLSAYFCDCIGSLCSATESARGMSSNDLFVKHRSVMSSLPSSESDGQLLSQPSSSPMFGADQDEWNLPAASLLFAWKNNGGDAQQLLLSRSCRRQETPSIHMIDTLLIGANHRDRDSSTGVGPIDPQQIFAFASVPLGPIISAASNTSDTASDGIMSNTVEGMKRLQEICVRVRSWREHLQIDSFRNIENGTQTRFHQATVPAKIRRDWNEICSLAARGFAAPQPLRALCLDVCLLYKPDASFQEIENSIPEYSSALQQARFLPLVTLHQIRADVQRCHSLDVLLSSCKEELHCVLLATVASGLGIEYMQGLDALAAPLVYLTPRQPSKAYKWLIALLKSFHWEVFQPGGAITLNHRMQQVNAGIALIWPRSAVMLGTSALSAETFTVSWVLSLFSHQLPIMLTLQLWDTLLMQHPRVVLHMASVLLARRVEKLFKESISLENGIHLLASALSDDEIWGSLKRAMNISEWFPDDFGVKPLVCDGDEHFQFHIHCASLEQLKQYQESYGKGSVCILRVRQPSSNCLADSIDLQSFSGAVIQDWDGFSPPSFPGQPRIIAVLGEDNAIFKLLSAGYAGICSIC